MQQNLVPEASWQQGSTLQIYIQNRLLVKKQKRPDSDGDDSTAEDDTAAWNQVSQQTPSKKEIDKALADHLARLKLVFFFSVSFCSSCLSCLFFMVENFTT